MNSTSPRIDPKEMLESKDVCMGMIVNYPLFLLPGDCNGRSPLRERSKTLTAEAIKPQHRLQMFPPEQHVRISS